MSAQLTAAAGRGGAIRPVWPAGTLDTQGVRQEGPPYWTHRASGGDPPYWTLSVDRPGNLHYLWRRWHVGSLGLARAQPLAQPLDIAGTDSYHTDAGDGKREYGNLGFILTIELYAAWCMQCLAAWPRRVVCVKLTLCSVRWAL
jgi:hypothetical protein